MPIHDVLGVNGALALGSVDVLGIVYPTKNSGTDCILVAGNEPTIGTRTSGTHSLSKWS